jgi:hypothetical protein
MTDHGLRIAAVKDGRIYDRQSLETNQFEIIEILMHARMAHLHSENISDKLKKSWVSRRKAAATTGKVMSAHLPGWLTVEGEGEERRIVADEYRAGGFAALAQTRSSESLALVADAKTRICTYGSEKVVFALAAFERAGASAVTTEGAAAHHGRAYGKR